MFRRKFMFLLVLLPLLLIAALIQLTEGSMEAIVWVIALLVGLLGPKPIEKLNNLLGVHGAAAVFTVYVVSFVVGALGLLVAAQLTGLEWSFANLEAIVGLFFAAATFAYHRLKDKAAICPWSRSLQQPLSKSSPKQP